MMTTNSIIDEEGLAHWIMTVVQDDVLRLDTEKQVWRGVDSEVPIPLIDWAIAEDLIMVAGDYLVLAPLAVAQHHLIGLEFVGPA